jgi:phage gp36-like protein
MPWREMIDADVLNSLTKAEHTAVDTLQLGVGQASPVATTIAGVVAEARARIAARPGNVLGAGDTVPDGIMHHLVAIARYRLLSRLPVSSLVTDARTQEYRDARKFLEDIAAGKVAVEPPEEAATGLANSAPTAEVVQSVDRNNRRSNMSGL